MMHLHSRIVELKRLLESRANVRYIRSKCDEIIVICKRLLPEHQSQSGVYMQLDRISDFANSIKNLDKSGLLRRNVNFDYTYSLGAVTRMESGIKEIGRILNIEFKEIES